MQYTITASMMKCFNLSSHLIKILEHLVSIVGFSL